MIKTLTIICALILNIQLFAQNDSIKTDLEFKQYVYECLDSFKTQNGPKQNLIQGVVLYLEEDGTLKRFEITFKEKEVKLRRKEYKWLFCLLEKRNYKINAIRYYTPEEFANSEELILKIKYIQKE